MSVATDISTSIKPNMACLFPLGRSLIKCMLLILQGNLSKPNHIGTSLVFVIGLLFGSYRLNISYIGILSAV